jgi:hypothetical protein
MALTPEEQKRLNQLQAREKSNKSGQLSNKLEKEKLLLLSKQNEKLSDQLKISKSVAKAQDEYEKSLKSSEKSLGSILGHLVKGNVQQAAQEAFGKKTLATTLLRQRTNERIQGSLKNHKDLSNVDAKNKIKILDLVNGINSGMYKTADVAATLEDIGEEELSTKSKLAKTLNIFAKMGEKEVEAKKETEKRQKALNKFTGEMVGLFGGLAAVATKFAATIDTIGKEFGNLKVLSNTFKNELIASSVEATKIGGSIQDVASISKTLSSEFGISSERAAELSGAIFDSSVAMGLSADEGSKLFGTLMQTAGLSRDQAEQLAEGTFQLANMNGVAPSVVMKDIAASSETIANFTKKGGKNIGEAAVQARKFGISLDTTAKIAEGLLDFENSITKEVEASVLIGKQLNFQKAREAALSGDIAGATREVVKQVGSEQEFLKLNIIQRKALADSIGVSVTEMSKLVGETDKLSLKGALASGSFADLLGKDSLSALSQAVAQFKALGATIINDLGPALLQIVSVGGALASIFTGIVGGLAEMGLLVPIVTAALGAFATKSIIAAYASVVKQGSLLPPPANLIAYAAGAAGVAGVMMQAKASSKMNDGIVSPGGITTMMGPAGVFSLNPKDSVLATTNPIPVNDMRMNTTNGNNVVDVNVNLTGKSTISGRNIDFFVEAGKEFAGGEPGQGQ